MGGIEKGKRKENNFLSGKKMQEKETVTSGEEGGSGKLHDSQTFQEVKEAYRSWVKTFHVKEVKKLGRTGGEGALPLNLWDWGENGKVCHKAAFPFGVNWIRIFENRGIPHWTGVKN